MNKRKKRAGNKISSSDSRSSRSQRRTATGQTRSSRQKQTKKKKPRVALDLKFVILFTAVVVAFCVGALMIAFSVDSGGRGSAEPEPFRQEITEPEVSAGKEQTSPEEAPEAPVEEELLEQEPDELSGTEQPDVGEDSRDAEIASVVSPGRIPEQPGEEEGSGEVVPPVSSYNIPDAVNNAELVFVIDDAGYSVENLKLYTSLPFPIAIAVLPRLPRSKECADLVRAAGKEVMLHQPMQALALSLNPGDGAILPGMSTIETYNTVIENISEIGPVAGMNNHEGSLITSDAIKMGAVLDAVYDENIFFLDSRTTAETRAPAAALERGMEILERDIFIDDEVDREKMTAQILRGLDIANRKGHAIMIGHVDKSSQILPALLLDMYPGLSQKGYKIVFPSDLLDD